MHSSRGLVCNTFNIVSRRCYDYGASLATAGTLQLEFQYLSDILQDDKYSNAVVLVSEKIHAMKKDIAGLYVSFIIIKQPQQFNTVSLKFTKEIYGLAGDCDSFYEYMLKMWLSTHDERYKDWYYESANVY
jgi:transcriptional/translational regulatory protein YebC/TACO1